MGAWTARGGWTIEITVRHGRPGYRVLRHGHLIAFCATLEELAERLELYGLDLGDLVEDDPECELRHRGRRLDGRAEGGNGGEFKKVIALKGGPEDNSRNRVPWILQPVGGAQIDGEGDGSMQPMSPVRDRFPGRRRVGPSDRSGCHGRSHR